MADEVDLSLFSGSKNKKKSVKKVEPEGITDSVDGPLALPTGPIISRPANTIYYDTNHVNLGVALIFNHEEIRGQKPRTGTEKDRSRIKGALRAYGFEVRTYDDRTFEQISEILKGVSKEDHRHNDCLVVVVMSHGLPGKIYAKDMAYPVERLWEPFLGKNCPTLINKPKIFFLQACRGEQLDAPVMFKTMARSRDVPDTIRAQNDVFAIPSTADLLVMYSTFEGHYSFRNPINGSWFIQSLCEVLENYASSGEEVELYNLLTAVNRKVAFEYQSNVPNNELFDEMKEMPNFVSTLTKTFYLRVKND